MVSPGPCFERALPGVTFLGCAFLGLTYTYMNPEAYKLLL